MIYNARKAKIERDRRRIQQQSTLDDDERMNEENVDDIEVNLDVALANWTRERRGQTLFQTFIEENEAFESSQYDLFHGACLIAMHANPELDVNEQKNRVKALAEEVEKELPENREERFTLRTIKKISTLLFNKEVNSRESGGLLRRRKLVRGQSFGYEARNSDYVIFDIHGNRENGRN
jgi:hypothetical protein